MKFEICKHGHFYEMVDNHGNHRIFGESTNCPYILFNDGEKDHRVNLLPSMKRELKIVMEGQ